MTTITLRLGDCASTMAAMPEGSVGVIVCDPPYGLEFMGKEWDRLDWQSGVGFAKPGIGERNTAWPSYSSTGAHGAANPTCAVCGGRLRGVKKCSCEQPHDHWKPVGKRRDPENEGLPVESTAHGSVKHLNAIFAWHMGWLREAFRVLKTGGVIKAFSGTRTYHRLAAAMEEVGFDLLPPEAWGYGSGFPKSLDVSKALDRAAGAEREVVGTRIVTRILNPEDIKKHNYVVGVEGRGGAITVTGPATDAARTGEGWGTAMKPAWEPVVVGRKPLWPGQGRADDLDEARGAVPNARSHMREDR